ncbi:MAG TPA: hypothetical protein VHU83_22275 [Bryobacteraceae bacterium]|nr:hypothetical protein [Bryobacteraceae bacterium]
MKACARCGTAMNETNRFCGVCGMDHSPVRTYPGASVQQAPQYPGPPSDHVPSRGFGQMFGLDPRIAFLAFVVDFMLFSGGALSVAATAGLSLPILFCISTIAGAVLGFATQKAQMKWYGDDRESALIKGLIVGLLTAIPVGIPVLVWVPSGILGWLHNRGKSLIPQA